MRYIDFSVGYIIQSSLFFLPNTRSCLKQLFVNLGLEILLFSIWHFNSILSSTSSSLWRPTYRFGFCLCNCGNRFFRQDNFEPSKSLHYKFSCLLHSTWNELNQRGNLVCRSNVSFFESGKMEYELRWLSQHVAKLVKSYRFFYEKKEKIMTNLNENDKFNQLVFICFRYLMIKFHRSFSLMLQMLKIREGQQRFTCLILHFLYTCFISFTHCTFDGHPNFAKTIGNRSPKHSFLY